MKISVKLPLFVVLVGAGALFLAEVVAHQNVRTLMLETGRARIQSVADSRAAAIKRSFAALRARFDAELRSTDLARAAEGFRPGHPITDIALALSNDGSFTDVRLMPLGETAVIGPVVIGPDEMLGVQTGATILVTANGARNYSLPPIVLVGPVKAEDGRIVAVLAAKVAPIVFQGILQDRAALGRTGVATFSAGYAPRGVQNNDRVNRSVGINIMSQPFQVAVSQTKAELFAPSNAFRTQMMLQGSAAILIMSVVALALARNISLPLTRFDAATAGIARGDYSLKVPCQSRRDEIGQLARRLDALRAFLLEAENSSRELAFKSAVYEQATSALMLTAPDLTVVYLNRKMTNFLKDHRIAFDRHSPGFHLETTIGRPLDLLFPGAEKMRNALEATPSIDEDLFLGAAHFRLHGLRICDDEGTLLGFMIRWTDVSEVEKREGLLDTVETLVPVADFSPEGRLVAANEPFQSWTRLTEASAVGCRWRDLFDSADPFSPGPDSVDRQAVNPSSDTSRPFAVVAKAKPDEPCAVVLRAVNGTSGRAQRFVLIALPKVSMDDAQAVSRDVIPLEIRT